MAQQKIMRSRLQKVLSSSTSSLAYPNQSYFSTHKTYEVRVGPIYPYSWHLHQQPPQGYQHVFIGRNKNVPDAVGQTNKGPYKKKNLVTRSFSDLRSLSLWQRPSSFRVWNTSLKKTIKHIGGKRVCFNWKENVAVFVNINRGFLPAIRSYAVSEIKFKCNG